MGCYVLVTGMDDDGGDGDGLNQSLIDDEPPVATVCYSY